ncbi:septin-10 isoform X12 [Grus americana]|uniref:septin-10 isoform X12 n=1 Tax=Grus americana TaxID=9117 RepID=UPI0024085EED|nr:septin-10 isoform X12 [Grus americana]
MAASHAGRQPQNDGYRTLSLSGHVGFGSLPDQLVKKSIKQGFCFNILCIGETGSGKSTLINSLFNTNFDDPVSTHFLPSVRLRAQTYELEESNVLLKLTIVNTVGFGDQINKEDRALSCTVLHLQKIKEVLFLGHSLKTLDLLTMKSLDSKGHLPFAVVGSTEEVKVGNKMVRARQYPWGVVQVENENHCDFVKLREMLICTNMEDLREQTHARHYELYRRCRLEEMGFRDVGPENKPVRLPCSKSYAARKTVCHNYASVESLQEAYEAKRNEFYLELQRKEEEMRQQFVQRVKEKEAILKEAEQQYAGKHRYAIAAHCFKNIWTCGTFLEYVVEDLVQSSWTGKTGCSHLLSVRLSHGHVYLSSNTGLIDIGNLCIFINVLFCTSVSQQRCFCKVFRCIF